MSHSIAILATGDEIISGDITNTNTQRISHELFSHELNPGMQLSCSDEESAMIDAMAFLLQHHDSLIITGGLGPTSDDRTRFALARLLGHELIFFEASWEHLKQRLNDLQLPLSPANKQQCLFPKDAKLLPNPHGSAMGCKIIANQKKIYMLPGPPHECLPMFNNFCLSDLLSSQRRQKKLLRWRIFGLPEGQISETLDNALKHLPCQTAYRWEYPYIEFKVNTDPMAAKQVTTIVESIIKSHVISPAEISASNHLVDYLLNNQDQLNIIDDATGGLLQTKLQHPSLHHRVHFNPQNNQPTTFHITGLTEYWQQTGFGTSKINLKFNTSDNTITEQHEIPYRNNSIPSYATEWIAHRIHQLLLNA